MSRIGGGRAAVEMSRGTVMKTMRRRGGLHGSPSLGPYGKGYTSLDALASNWRRGMALSETLRRGAIGAARGM